MVFRARERLRPGWTVLSVGAGSAALAALLSLAGDDGSTPRVVQTRRALDFVADAAKDWQDRFDCSGCHKQAITLSALGTARSNGHDPARPGIVQALLEGMLGSTSGQDENGCFSLRGQSSFTMATTFGGRGLAAYDRHLGGDREPNLLAAADCLVGRQAADGSLVSDHTELPVAQGSFITTAHGVFAWEQAFAASSDPSHRQAADDGVAWLRGQIAGIEASPATFTTQDKAMLLAALGRAGADATDADVVRMRDLLASEQLPDGSWKLRDSQTGGNAHATGQAVFALRAAGYDRGDAAVDAGTGWLLDNQQADGSWPADHWEGAAPSDIAPSMWGALALATYDSELDSLRLSGGADTQIEWAAVEGADAFDVVRGPLDGLAELADRVDLGVVICLASNTAAGSAQDNALPSPGAAFFYLMRIRWGAEHDIYGRSSGGLDRIPGAADCPQ